MRQHIVVLPADRERMQAWNHYYTSVGTLDNPAYRTDITLSLDVRLEVAMSF